MPFERFDIEVRDAVARTIRTELKGIGAEARSTHSIVQQMNAELAAGSRAAASSAQTAAAQASGAAGRTAAAQAKANAETARGAAAQAKLSNEQTRAALSAQKLAQAQAKTAEAQAKANTAYLNEEAALNRAIAAEQRAISSKQRLAAASDKTAAAAQRELRITPSGSGVQPGSGTVIGSMAGSRATAANAARIMSATVVPSAGPTPSETREIERFARQVRALKDELDPAAAATAKFAAQHDLLNRGLEQKILTLAEHRTATAALKRAEEEAAAATLALGGASHVGAGQIREMLVVAREIARGDMTRLPGSLTILAQRFNLLGSLTVPMVLGFGAVAGTLAVLTVAAAAGEKESNKLANTLSLSGNTANLTSGRFEEMAQTISDATRTSIGSNKELLLSIAGNSRYTADEMGKLITAAQELARATGQSADDVLGDFAKMADGPTKYAETFYDQYSGVITPTLVDHVRQLEATGQSYQATKILVDGITEGLARNQVEQTGIIIRAWRAVTNTVSQAWDALKGIGTASSTAQELAKVNQQIAMLANGGQVLNVLSGHMPLPSMDTLKARQAFLQRQIAGEQIAAEATARHTRELRLQEQGVQALNGTYGRLVDNHYRYTNDIAKLQNTMRNAVGWGSIADPSTHFEEVLARAAKSNDMNVRNMASSWTKALDKLKKQDMPDLYRAEHKKPPHPRKGRQPWDREGAVEEDTTHLDEQIAALKDYGQALTEANMLESISRKYREHKVPLTEAETASMRKQIHTLEEGKRVQQAMTAAEEAANGPRRTYDAAQEALNNLMEKGAIDQREYARQLYLVEEAYRSAVDPLYELNKELDRNAELVAHFGKDRTLREYVQQLEQAAKARGESIYQAASGLPANDNGDITVTARSKKLTPEAQTMVDEYRRQKETEKYTSAFDSMSKESREDPTSSSFVLDHYKEMYAEIQRFRDEDVANEEEAARRKQDLDRKLIDARLEGASGMFGQLAELQNSSVREVAAIGKAAAIMQATIDGYRAVQAALAGPPGPPWSFAIAGVTAAMTAVNVARIAGVGFQRGGYTGDGYAGDEAGPAHRGEYIFDASATSRIGVPALDALKRGVLNPVPANDQRRGANIRIVQGPGTYVEAVEKSDGEIEVIAERVARRVAPHAVADDIAGSPNGRVGKAMHATYGVRRKR